MSDPITVTVLLSHTPNFCHRNFWSWHCAHIACCRMPSHCLNLIKLSANSRMQHVCGDTDALSQHRQVSGFSFLCQSPSSSCFNFLPFSLRASPVYLWCCPSVHHAASTRPRLHDSLQVSPLYQQYLSSQMVKDKAECVDKCGINTHQMFGRFAHYRSATMLR